MTLFFPKYFDVKLNFCCNEFKLKLNWYILANTIDVVKNFVAIKNVTLRVFTDMHSLCGCESVTPDQLDSSEAS